MRKIEGTANRFRYFLTLHGVTMSEEAIMDAVYELDALYAAGECLNVALYHYWQRHAAYPLEPSVCAECGQAFLDWDGRARAFCCDACKVKAENARWYSRHTPDMIRRVLDARHSMSLNRQWKAYWKGYAAEHQLISGTHEYNVARTTCRYRWEKEHGITTARQKNTDAVRHAKRRRTIQRYLDERGIEATPDTFEAILSSLPDDSRADLKRVVETYIKENMK